MSDRDAINLGVCRMLMFAFALVHYGLIDFTEWARLPEVFWNPIFLFRKLASHPPAFELLWAVQCVWRVSLVFSCVGLFTRVATFVAGISGFYLIALPNNFGNIHRSDSAFVLALLVMALSRSGDAWSLDAVLARRRGKPVTRPAWRLEYKWSVTAVRILLALSFFAAGFAKLRHRGLEWITSDSLAIMLSEQARLLREPLLPSVTLWLVAHPLWCNLLAAATVAIETLQPLALISRIARLLLIPGVTLMLLGIRALHGPPFIPLIALQVFWVDWPWVLDKLRRQRG